MAVGNVAITVTSLGGRTAGSVLPVIDPSQVAILGIDWIVERRGVAALTLAGDHRVPDRIAADWRPCRVETAAGGGPMAGEKTLALLAGIMAESRPRTSPPRPGECWPNSPSGQPPRHLRMQEEVRLRPVFLEELGEARKGRLGRIRR